MDHPVQSRKRYDAQIGGKVMGGLRVSKNTRERKKRERKLGTEMKRTKDRVIVQEIASKN